MNAFLVVTFVALMCVEGVGTGAFLAIYLRGDWRATAVGRHLAYYSGALLFLYVSSLLSLVVHEWWLVAAILLGHFGFATMIWQRVWLVWRAHRAPLS